MQNSTRYWAFSKGERFFQLPSDNNAKYLAFPACFSNEYSTFGFGERIILKNLPARDTPAPTHYRIPSASDSTKMNLSKGKSFRIPRRYYENAYASNQTNVVPKVAAANRYSHLKANPLGRNTKKFSIKSRVPPALEIPFPPLSIIPSIS